MSFMSGMFGATGGFLGAQDATLLPFKKSEGMTASAGSFHCAVILSERGAFGWGANGGGRANAPTEGSSTRAKMISCGGIHTAVLMEDGGVECWGRCHERIAPPAKKIISISAGGSHTLVLTSDGKVSAFGNAAFGSANPPRLSVRVKQISAGGSHSTVLLENGRIICWGRIPQHNIPTEKAACISAGESHSIAILTQTQQVVGWGDNSSGQSSPPHLDPPPITISAGGRHSLALLSNGTVVGWGHSGNRRISSPPFQDKVVQISAGGMHSLAVDEKGKVYVWGYNGNGQQNIPHPEEQVTQLRKTTEQSPNKSSRCKPLKPRKPRLVRQQDAFIRTFTQLPIFQTESMLSLPPPKSRPRPAAAVSFALPFNMEFDSPLPLSILSQRLPSIKVRNKTLPSASEHRMIPIL